MLSSVKKTALSRHLNKKISKTVRLKNAQKQVASERFLINLHRTRFVRDVQPEFLAFHQFKELGVGLGGLHLVENELHGFHLIHVVNEFAQHPDFG